MRGAVLGDETAVAMAGCNTSSHCRGWLEGSHGKLFEYVPTCIFLDMLHKQARSRGRHVINSIH